MKTLLIFIGIVLLGANAFIHDRAARSSVKLRGVTGVPPVCFASKSI
jgi:hypothetical protein